MNVQLLHYTPLVVVESAIRTCWDSFDKSDSNFETYSIGNNGLELIDRVGNKNKHKSVLEHAVQTFRVSGISRATLIELTRHRMCSYSVMSTRYTLHKYLSKEEEFKGLEDKERASKYLVFTGNDTVDSYSIVALENLRKLIKESRESNNEKIPNDKLKYILPEAFKTELIMTINLRSLQNLLELRSSLFALEEIRELAFNLFKNSYYLNTEVNYQRYLLPYIDYGLELVDYKCSKNLENDLLEVFKLNNSYSSEYKYCLKSLNTNLDFKHDLVMENDKLYIVVNTIGENENFINLKFVFKERYSK